MAECEAVVAGAKAITHVVVDRAQLQNAIDEINQNTRNSLLVTVVPSRHPDTYNVFACRHQESWRIPAIVLLIDTVIPTFGWNVELDAFESLLRGYTLAEATRWYQRRKQQRPGRGVVVHAFIHVEEWNSLAVFGWRCLPPEGLAKSHLVDPGERDQVKRKAALPGYVIARTTLVFECYRKIFPAHGVALKRIDAECALAVNQGINIPLQMFSDGEWKVATAVEQIASRRTKRPAKKRPRKP